MEMKPVITFLEKRGGNFLQFIVIPEWQLNTSHEHVMGYALGSKMPRVFLVYLSLIAGSVRAEQMSF